MFTHTAQPLSYAPPWTAPYHQRRRALVARARRVAYLYERPDTSTFRYRVFNMIEALDAAPSLEVSASWFTLDDIDHDISFVDQVDALVICRTRYDDRVGRVVARARARGARVLYDVDDLIFDPAYVPLITQALDVTPLDERAWDVWFAYVTRLGATLQLCDAATVTNASLAEQVAAYRPGMQVAVIPNFLNRLQAQLSRELMAAKRKVRFGRDGFVDIGYFSGTPTHNRDLAIAAPALAAVLARFPNARLRVVGFIEVREELSPFADRIELLPLQDFLNLQRVTAPVEIAIAPLQSNTFSNCKSELKYFEAGVVGVLTVASPSPAFAAAIEHGVTGFLARSHEWFDTLCGVIEMVEAQPDAHIGMAERVAADCERRYAWNGHGATIVGAIFGPDETSGRANRTTVDAHTGTPVTR